MSPIGNGTIVHLNPIITILFWIAVVGLLSGLTRRATLWRAGRKGAVAPVQWIGLLAIPKRYFVDLHHVVARDPYIARTHIATAGGAIAAMALVAINYGFMLYWPLLNAAIALFAVVMLVGVIFVWHRRRTPPARLSLGAWNRLPWVLGALALGLLLMGILPVGVVSGLTAVVTVLLLGFGAWNMTVGIGRGGPMKHALAGLLHLAFHPRPERFQQKAARTGMAKVGVPTIGVPTTALKPLALNKGELGVRTPLDFRWNQLLSFDACVQCGKCEAACPAFAAGQPLNPKKLIQDMVLGMAGGSDAHFAGSPYPGIPLGQHQGGPQKAIFPGLISPDTIWSCTTCRACVEECPMLIEHVDAVVDMRRNLTLEDGAVPGKGPEVLANLRETATAGGFDLNVRYNWSIDLNITQIAPGKSVDVLLIVGEGGFDMRYQRSLRALVKVLQAGAVDFAILGALETDTGDVARRLGDEATFQSLAKRLICTLSTLSFKRIVTADPHVMHCLRNEYPAFGGRYEVFHHTTFMAALAKQGQITPRVSIESDQRFTYHDPCYLGRYNGEIEAPRELLKLMGLPLHEMERNGMRGRCCGGGGGAPLTDIPGKQRIPDIRIHDARAVKADTLVVGCPNCTAMLEGVVGPRPDIRDIAELVAAALEA
ncbi:(Fe-S)-binding protein [Glaciimonas sp. CA11.2]|uniref:(Fe-S)-binding protein n=1 Tax=Glaciimonas sp. CA11.2 TaxID=3048601 RepID=UPI002AB3C4BF|nr:(Fe-S)-binding protein [Glaciimonas sp. CA11.2]MDY7547503.1 (Fe-S)-binding protein [Glaciimonas sp. CA11.2]MEB0162328.1 (Fe-S)-binding protein [Glaciimonas sp. CA11.2]